MRAKWMMLGLLLVGPFGAGASIGRAGVVVVDFDGVPSQDYVTYSEDGFAFEANVGEVRISDTFAEVGNLAHPSFGFGQGLESRFIVTNENGLPFGVLSIDLLEASGVPEGFGITMMGTKSDSSTVSQTFTLDGISGAETFWLSGNFTELVLLEIREDVDNAFTLEKVGIDNVTFDVIPEPVSGLLVLLGGTGVLRRRKRQ